MGAGVIARPPPRAPATPANAGLGFGTAPVFQAP